MTHKNPNSEQQTFWTDLLEHLNWTLSLVDDPEETEAFFETRAW